MDGIGVGRVIARPFIARGQLLPEPAPRHDYAVDPPNMLLDVLEESAVAGIRQRQDPNLQWRGVQETSLQKAMMTMEKNHRCVATAVAVRDLLQYRRLRHALRSSQGRRRFRPITWESINCELRFLPLLQPSDLL